MNQRDAVHVRLATPGDIEAARAVHRAAFAPLRPIYRPTGEAAARQEERFQKGRRLVAELGGEIVGTVQFIEREDDIHVLGLAVHPDYRGRGVATALAKWITAHAPELGYRRITLDAVREADTVEWFQRLGFTVAEETVADWAESDIYEEVHNIAMELKL